MGLSKLAAQCERCPYKDTCNNKMMEEVGYLQPTQQVVSNSMEESVITPHDYRQVKIAPNTEVTIDLEDFKKEIEKSIAKSAGLYGGFFNNCS